MHIRLSPAVMVLSAALAGAGVAAADPAPITYAGQGAPQPVQTASIEENRLAGGADNSYGYGRERTRSGAVIDLRRPTAPQSASQQQAAAPREQGRPAWLEQERVGPPYEANGRWYVPTAEPGHEQSGVGSWYGPTFHGRLTASGETYDQDAMTAAHPTLPLNSLVQVTNLENGREVIVRINDRGPYVGERLIDLSRAGALALGYEQAGTARVHVRYLGPAPRRVNTDGATAPAPIAPASYQAPSPAPLQAAQQDGPLALTVSAPVESAVTTAPTLQQTSYTAPAPTGAFVVQVGAYSDLENAHRVRGLVEQAGPVNVDVRQTARGELFRVRVGPWQSREEAEAARRTLAGLGYPEAVVAQR